jgi:hypothetical protein
VPFDSGVFTTPLSASNSVGSDNEMLTITVAPLAAANTTATIKFTDGYKDTKKQDHIVPSGAFQFSSLVNTPGIDVTTFNDKLTFDVTVGLFEFSGKLGDALKSGKFTPGKSASFKFTDSVNGHTVNLGGMTLALGKGAEMKITCRRKGNSNVGGVETIHSEQLAGTTQIVSEMIPVKIQIGSTLVAAFYVQANGIAGVKISRNPSGGTFKLSTVKLKGFGGSSPVQ